MPSAKKNLLKIIVTGATGLVGSRFVQLSAGDFSIITIGRSNVDFKVDLLSPREVKEFVQQSDARVVVNFAAFTNVDGAEKEKGDKEGEVFTLNALLPFWLAEVCRSSGKRLCHISTDYVFDGKKVNKPYTEKNTPSPVDSWYAITKMMGEEKVAAVMQGEGYSIVRISFPYSGLYYRKLDFARVIYEKLRKNEPYLGIINQKIKPTSVDDISQAIAFLLNKNADGIYHVAGNYLPEDYITPYRFAVKLAELFNFSLSLIQPITFAELSEKRLAPRPQHTWLDTKKIESLGFCITNIDAALVRFKKQLVSG